MRTFNTNYLKQTFILLSDLTIVAIAFVSSIYVIFGTLDITLYQMEIAIAMIIYLVMFRVFHTFFLVVKYLGEKDYMNTLFASTGALTCLLALQAFVEGFDLPFKIIVLSSLVSLNALLFFRWFMKKFHPYIRRYHREKTRTAIFGAGKMAHIVLDLSYRQGESMNVVAFFDDDPSLQNRWTNNVRIYNPETHFEKVIKRKKIGQVIFAVENLPEHRKAQIANKCLKMKVKVLSVPSFKHWINGKLFASQLQTIRVEDLLNRDEIFLNRKKIAEDIFDRIILVTGAAGSIGSEIVRQLLCFRPRKVLLLDQAESALVDLGLELKEKYNFHFYKEIIADVTDFSKMESVFRNHQPDIVFHAAAYKHVPILESHPYEAVRTNVMGTRVLAELSHEYRVQKFIMISTDKAINPTSIMGATKRVAELLVEAKNQSCRTTSFMITRFGNVLGSNGSVVPRFTQQIQNGGPVTVTHPDIRRYFMTIPEACQLVLEASTMGKGGEVFLFDMGEPVRISDLAEKMIQLAGYKPGEDIRIVYTGLRPGEKLFEELSALSEDNLETYHPKIMIVKNPDTDFDVIATRIQYLIDHLHTMSPAKIMRSLQVLVPEYTSNNALALANKNGSTGSSVMPVGVKRNRKKESRESRVRSGDNEDTN